MPLSTNSRAGPEKYSPAALQCTVHISTISKIADQNFRSDCPERIGTLIFASYQSTNGQTALAKHRRDRAPHCSDATRSARNKNRIFSRHRNRLKTYGQATQIEVLARSRWKVRAVERRRPRYPAF